MARKKGLKKRVWSDDEKRTICAQALTAGVSVAQVARRYAMNANLIFKWLKDPRFAPTERASSVEESVALEGVFLPVEIEPSAMESPSALARMNDVALRANKRETIEWLKFTLEGAGERTHGYASTDTTFAGCWI